MSSKPELKPGRNEPCWCGSGKKYKNCHLRQDEDEARASVPILPTPPAKSIAPFTPPELPKPREPSPEELAEEAEWDQFENADLDGKIAFFLERLENRRLDKEYAFEAYLQIRDESSPRHDATARARLTELIERLRRDMPEVYKDSAVYLEDLITFAVTEERWDALPEWLAEFAEIADKHPDEFSSVTKMMLYHGQTQPLLAAMQSAWHNVSTSKDILEWGVNEYYGTMLELALYQYLETTATPRADAPGLLETINAFGGKPNPEWLTTAVKHLSAPAPSSWRAEDFGATVDAETWEHNVHALLFDWMAEERRRAAMRVPFSKSDLFKEELQGILHQQISEREPAPKGKHGKSKRVIASMVASPLIPRRDHFERTLVDKFDLFGSEPYEAGALIELLPSYLHFLARLHLIHPTEMDDALTSIKPLTGNTLKLLDSHGADVHLLRAVESAWSDATLNSLRDDPALVSARAMPVVIPSTTPAIAEAQTYRFKVSYRHTDDVWFIVETSSKHSLDDLHDAIIDVADFDDDHLHAFFLSGRAWDKETEYGHGEARYSSAISIGKLQLRMKQRFLYLFDFGDQHEFDVQLIETRPEPPRETRTRPRVLEQHGKLPPQYPDWDDESEDEDDWEEEDDEASAH
ncbi:MAG: SEC-C domain-containing protein [Chloroflexi bacterium]|nr:SEC-C domain-containing protein [Chloroflexota bacterium]